MKDLSGNAFWQEMTDLVASRPVVIDRPRGAKPIHVTLFIPNFMRYLYNTHGHKLRFPNREKAQFVTALVYIPKP